jgi:uncharacterized YccA/Bax inhibitor family protein
VGTADWVAIILAAGVSLALITATAAVAYTGILTGKPVGENITQILTGWGGGIIGVLGAYVGKKISDHQNGNGKT